MTEWTEQEEQQIIERAKTGDPEANYELSLWALRRGEEEPDEPRWNRLAAKCLVKAAQSGYGPAQEQMNALLQTNAAQKKAPASKPTKAADPVSIVEVRQAAARRTPAHHTTARRPSRREEPDEDFDTDDPGWDDEEEDDEAPPARRGRAGRASRAQPEPSERSRRGGQPAGGKWGDAQWRKMEIICIGLCAVLLVFIAAMMLSGPLGSRGGENGSSVPPAGQVAPAENDGSGTPAATYPDEATKNAIMAADLSIKPENEDYMPGATSATVSVGSVSLRMRKGPNTTYDLIGEIPNEAVVSVYAAKNDWYLVLYTGDGSPVYGWCNSQYLILNSDAGTAAAGAGADDADSVG